MYQSWNPFYLVHFAVVHFAVVLYLGGCLLPTVAAAQDNEAPTITSDPITTGLVGELYTYDVEATGSPDPTFLLVIAPQGMDIDAQTGEITWTPTEAGDAEVAIVAANGVLPIATQSFTIEVSGGAPVITSTPVTSTGVGSIYLYDVNATGNPEPTYSLREAPEGMNIDETLGIISWVANEVGTFDVTVVASNGIRPDATQSFTIEVSGDGPVITSSPITTAALGEAYVYDVEASGNPDPTYDLETAPDGMVIDMISGLISWAPTEAGTFDVVVIASNGTMTDASQAFTINVTGAAPVITSTPVTTVILGNTYAYDVQSTGDPAPMYSLDQAPDGMNINPSTGSIFWPTSEAGDFDVIVVASNGALPDASQAFTVEVTGIAPAITTSPVTSVALGSTYQYDVNARGNPQQTFSLNEAPEGMDIDPTSGMITWEPDALGQFDVSVTASNGIGPDAIQSFTVEVTGIPPTITSKPIDNGFVGSSYTYDVNAGGTPDPTFALTLAPPGMKIDPATGIISWMPSQEGSFSIEVAALNGVEPNETQSYTLTIFPEIEPPIIISSPLELAAVNKTYTYDVDAIGAPSPQYSLTSAPTGMNIDPLSGVITWTPTAEGTFNVTVIAFNGASVVATQSFSVEATASLFAPTLTSAPPTQAALGEVYSYRATASGNPSPFYSLSQAPLGMTIDPASGIVSWIPIVEGSYDVTITASNGIGQDDSQSFTLIVTTEKFAPEIQSSPITIALVNQPYTYQAKATGSPNPTFALNTAPAGMSIDPISGVISWRPTSTGDYEVIVAASNDEGEDDVQAYTLTVTQGQFAPIITSNPATITAPNEAYTYRVTAIGNPAPTFSVDAPPGVSIDSQSGLISWTPSAVGSFEVIVIASNGLVPDYVQPFTILVTNDSFAPSITSIPLTTATLNTPYVFNLEATGNPAPAFSLQSAPNGMTIDPISGVISWLPTVLGTFEVTVLATNGVAPEASKTFTITVGAPVHNAEEEALVDSFEMGQNYPNPFVSATTIEYRLPAPDHVYISIYDALGRKVRVLKNAFHSNGIYRIVWDGQDHSGSLVPAGVYFAKVQTQSGHTHVVSMLKLQ